MLVTIVYADNSIEYIEAHRVTLNERKTELVIEMPIQRCSYMIEIRDGDAIYHNIAADVVKHIKSLHVNEIQLYPFKKKTITEEISTPPHIHKLWVNQHYIN